MLTSLNKAASVVIPYEQQLSQNVGWAMSEGSVFFEGRGKVQESLQRIARRLDELSIPYAIAGGMALFMHGYRRFTEDVDILVSRDGLEKIHAALDGLGYVPPFAGSKHLRDAESGVKIEFIVTGGFPGDGKPKPVAFPNPVDVAMACGGVQVVNLPTLITLKLASGMSAPSRAKDLADVLELIKHTALPQSLAQQLDPSVRDKYNELWQYAQEPDEL